MKNRISWVVVSCLIVLVLVMTSCGQATPAATTNAATTIQGTANQTQTVIPPTSVTPVTTPTTSKVEVPKYGGVARVIESADPRGFDYMTSGHSKSWSLSLTNGEIMEPDWTRGPVGTGEVSYGNQGGFEGIVNYYHDGGGLAESWEIDPVNNAIILHIRQGVYWATNPASEASKLVNGRQLTADDIAFNINRVWSTNAGFLAGAYYKPVSVKLTDKWTVVVKLASFSEMTQDIGEIGDHLRIVPPEVVAKYGDMLDWHNSVGTGPFMLTDYVKGSSMTLVRNPNYWDKDPIGPGKGNQLPYLDGVKILIITDVSTQLAAMRTNKADQWRFEWDMAATLKKTNPELKWSRVINNTGMGIEMRIDDPSVPWANLKVRQALRIGVDLQAIADKYYGGEADVYSLPTVPGPEYNDIRVPFNQLPQSVQDLWKYQPDKAKELLANAGYANGFTMELVCETTYADLLSIYKDYWSKIGVTLVLAPKELAVYNSIMNARTYKQAIYAQTNTQLPLNMDHVRDPKTSMYNRCFVVDARCQQAHADIWANYLDWNKRCQIYKDITPYILENCWIVPNPASAMYVFWQPWVKNYHGEWDVGNGNDPNWCKWVWYDQDLKENMTGAQ